MKKYSVIIFLVLCAAAYIIIINRSLSRSKSELRLKNVEISTLKDSVKVLMSKNGDLTFKFQSVQIESKERKDALELLGFELSDLRQRDIKQKNIIIIGMTQFWKFLKQNFVFNRSRLCEMYGRKNGN